ncbi:MAG: hypothetical protein N2C14_27330, partial [Planctomycetales bacterium]
MTEPDSLTSERKLLGNDQLWLLLTVLAIAFVLRVGVLQTRGDSLLDDPDSYRKWSENLYRTGVYGEAKPRRNQPVGSLGMRTRDQEIFPSAHRPPLYPCVLLICVPFGTYAPLA